MCFVNTDFFLQTQKRGFRRSLMSDFGKIIDRSNVNGIVFKQFYNS